MLESDCEALRTEDAVKESVGVGDGVREALRVFDCERNCDTVEEEFRDSDSDSA